MILEVINQVPSPGKVAAGGKAVGLIPPRLLEKENARLKKLLAEVELEKATLKDPVAP